MFKNYYIDENGNYIEKPSEQNYWKAGYSKRGYLAMQKYKYKVNKRKRFFQKIRSFFSNLFSWIGGYYE